MNFLRIFSASIVVAGVSFCVANAHAQESSWTQWGGENRDFEISQEAIGEKLEVTELWKRDLGDGYSAILCENGKLFTMYRSGEEEIVVCLDASNGKTVWEYRYPAPLDKEADTSFGKGPNSTPLISGDKLITVGFNSDVNCLDKNTGKSLWSTNLIGDHGGTPLQFGYSASPINYEDKIILPVGGEGKAIMAFNVTDGSVAWSALDFANSYSTPLLNSVDGVDQMVFAMTDEVIAINPKNGELFWNFPLKNQWSTHAFVPVWDADNQVLFVSSFRQSHALKLSRDASKTQFEKVWSVEKTGIGFTNAVQVGDVVYGSTGGQRSPLVTAISMGDGKVLWRERGFGVSNYLAVGDKLVILDEKGTLAIASPSSENLALIGKQELFEAQKGWTVPTFVDGTLYVRDQKQIGAFQLK